MTKPERIPNSECPRGLTAAEALVRISGIRASFVIRNSDFGNWPVCGRLRESQKARWTRSLPCLSLPLVSKPTKATAAQTDGGKEVPFEEALKKLETIVESMESDELPLETLLARFEEGTRLTRICQTKLAEAELKIQQ